MLVEIQKIDVGSRARPVTDSRVDALIDSIADVGLLNPITVVEDMVVRSGQSVKSYKLVAGAHRLEATRRRGDTEIEATVVCLGTHERRLAECDENLCGTNLGSAERATLTVIRKECYEFLHPETVHGRGRTSETSRKVCDSDSTNDPKRFTTDTAETTGRAERTIQLDAERGEKILPVVMAKIVGTKLDTGSFLDEVKGLKGSKQMKFVTNRLDRKDPKTCRPPGPKAKPDLPRLKKLSTDLDNALRKATSETRSQFYSWHLDIPSPEEYPTT